MVNNGFPWWRNCCINLYHFKVQTNCWPFCRIDRIDPIGKPGTAHFYESLNFKELENFIPMAFYSD
jgi:hypothetical protein